MLATGITRRTIGNHTGCSPQNGHMTCLIRPHRFEKTPDAQTRLSMTVAGNGQKQRTQKTAGSSCHSCQTFRPRELRRTFARLRRGPVRDSPELPWPATGRATRRPPLWAGPARQVAVRNIAAGAPCGVRRKPPQRPLPLPLALASRPPPSLTRLAPLPSAPWVALHLRKGGVSLCWGAADGRPLLGGFGLPSCASPLGPLLLRWLGGELPPAWRLFARRARARRSADRGCRLVPRWR